MQPGEFIVNGNKIVFMLENGEKRIFDPESTKGEAFIAFWGIRYTGMVKDETYEHPMVDDCLVWGEWCEILDDEMDTYTYLIKDG